MPPEHSAGRGSARHVLLELRQHLSWQTLSRADPSTARHRQAWARRARPRHAGLSREQSRHVPLQLARQTQATECLWPKPHQLRPEDKPTVLRMICAGKGHGLTASHVITGSACSQNRTQTTRYSGQTFPGHYYMAEPYQAPAKHPSRALDV